VCVCVCVCGVCVCLCVSFPFVRGNIIACFLSKLSHKQHDFRKKLLNTKCVFCFSVQLLSETFLIVNKNMARDITIKVQSCSCKVPLVSSQFDKTCNFLNRFFEKSSYMKIRSVGAELFRADRHEDGRTDMTQLIVAFRNFAKST
jgi:hypothetical protein